MTQGSLKEFLTPVPASACKDACLLESATKDRSAQRLSTGPPLLHDEPNDPDPVDAQPEAKVTQFYTKPKRPLNSTEANTVITSPATDRNPTSPAATHSKCDRRKTEG